MIDLKTGASVLILFLSASSARAAAQGLVPLDAQSVVQASLGSDHLDASVSVAANGTVVHAWHAGQNIFARFFNSSGMPLSGDLFVNDTIAAGNQDQPEIAFGTSGRALVAWSDREGNDGQLIGIFARIFDPVGIPITAEFQVNAIFLASQFRPAIAPTPSGGWVVAWTGEFDGDAFFRVLDADGAPLTPDVPVNTFDRAAQTLPDPAVLPNGRLLVAFEDSSNFGGVGGGINLWGRLFQLNGAAITANEFPIASTTTAGDQQMPRCAVDEWNQRYLVVWEDSQNDGDGWGIFGRVFLASGAPLAPEFPINTTTAGNQRRPDVAADPSGFFVVTWDSGSGAATEIRAQRLRPDGTPFGSEIVVNEGGALGFLRPAVAVDPSTGEVVFAYDGPGTGSDVFTRRFAAPCSVPPQNYCGSAPNSVGPGALVSWTGSTNVTANDLVLVASGVPPASFGLFFYGRNQIVQPAFNGVKCVGGGGLGLFRLGPSMANGAGVAQRAVNYLAQPNPAGVITPGSIWNFQYFYRDSVGTMANYSDALRIEFCP